MLLAQLKPKVVRWCFIPGESSSVLWRRLRLDGAYLVGELIIVVSGVLLALAVDSWNDARLDRAEEALVLDRLAADLQLDTANYAFVQRGLEAKVGSLRQVRDVLVANMPLLDSTSFIAQVVRGANFGWNQPVALRATYDDLIGSGRLGLVRSVEVRDRLARYYALDTDIRNRILPRRTGYPALSYRLVPRREEFEPETDLSPENLRRIVAQIQSSDLEGEITAELNLARFIAERFRELDAAARELLAQVEDP